MALKKVKIGRNVKTGKFTSVKKAEKAKKSHVVESFKNNSF